MTRFHLRLVATAAVAALPAAVAAQASTVTVYGRVDLSVTRQNDGTSTMLNGSNGQTGAAGKRWDLRPGSAGRIGFRGNEDLGGGTHAGFLFEHRFAPDTGTANTPFWQARSFVEIGRKALGTVYLGREYIPAFWVGLRTDPWGFDTVATLGTRHQFAMYRIDDADTRANNSVGWRSPNWGGFTVNLATAAGEGVRSRADGANVEYRQGPVYLGVGVDKIDDRNKVALIGFAWDFKVVRPAVTLTRSTYLGVDHENVSVSMTAPIGSGILKAGVARLDPDGADNENTKIGLGYEHLLSKRTSLMANVASSKQDGLLAGRPRTRTSVVEFGVKHNF